MEQNQLNETFQYTYSAKEQEEVERIRNKYVPREESKMDQLRKMDAKVTEKATVYSIALGIIGVLTLGIGMCCCLVWAEHLFVPGIIIGLIGLAASGAAYPAYQQTLKKEREKIAPEILRLADELIK